MRETNYWTTRFNRRRLLRSAGAAGAGVAGLAIVGCGDDDDDDGEVSATNQAQASSTPSSGSPVSGGTLTQGLVGATFGSQDPHSTPNGQTITPKVYNYLLRSAGALAPDEPLIPDLSESYELMPDNVTIVFKIRPDAVIAPNNRNVPERPLDSDDVLKNWERIGDPNIGANNLGFYNDHVDSIDAPDATTFRMVLKSPYAFAVEQICAHSAGTMAPKEILGNDDLKTNPIGAGPFMQTELADGDHCTLDRNPNYFKSGQPYLDTWFYQQFQDLVTARTAFQGGQTDTYGAQNADEAKDIQRAKPDVQYIQSPSANYTGIWMNTRVAPWNDERVRRAVALATNREEYIALVGHGAGDPTGPITAAFTQYVLPPDELEELQPFDVGEAKSLFEAAGVSEFPVVYYAVYADYLNILVRQMQQAGVTVQAQPLDSGTWVTQFYENDFPATIFGHNLYSTPDFALAWYKTHGVIGGDHYDTGFSDPEIDGALDDAAATIDDEERFAAYKDVQRMILQRSPALINIYTAYQELLLAQNVRDYPSGAGTRLNLHCDEVWKA